MTLVDQRADVGQGGPGILAARIPPFLDRLENRLRLVAAERPVHIDDDQRRPVSEAAADAIAGRLEHRLVAVGEELVPDRFRHEWFSYHYLTLAEFAAAPHKGALRRSAIPFRKRAAAAVELWNPAPFGRFYWQAGSKVHDQRIISS